MSTTWFAQIPLISNWIIFILLFVIIAISSIFIPKFLVSFLGKKSKNSIILGVFILSFITSLPEILTVFFFPALSASADAGLAKAFANILGSNIITGVFFCFLFVFFFRKVSTNHLPKEIKFTSWIILLINIFVICIFVFPNSFIAVKWGKITIASLIFVVFYLIFLLYSFLHNKNVKKTTNVEFKINLFKYKKLNSILFLWIIILIAILTVSIIILIKLTNHLQNYYHFSNQTVGGAFFAMATTSPEIWVSISLFFYGFSNAALGVIVGSHLFNFILFFALDVSSGYEIWINLQNNLKFNIILASFFTTVCVIASQWKVIQNQKKNYYLIPYLIVVALPLILLNW